jgi:hypothetical protein
MTTDIHRRGRHLTPRKAGIRSALSMRLDPSHVHILGFVCIGLHVLELALNISTARGRMKMGFSYHRREPFARSIGVLLFVGPGFGMWKHNLANGVNS